MLQMSIVSIKSNLAPSATIVSVIWCWLQYSCLSDRIVSSTSFPVCWFTPRLCIPFSSCERYSSLLAASDSIRMTCIWCFKSWYLRLIASLLSRLMRYCSYCRFKSVWIAVNSCWVCMSCHLSCMESSTAMPAKSTSVRIQNISVVIRPLNGVLVVT